MITQVISAVDNILLPFNFFCNTLIFLGGMYVVLHSRSIPAWVSTCLWYIGLSSLFTSITILLDWGWGPEFPMSYTNIGLFGEILSLVTLAGSVLLLFGKTLIRDIKYKKQRQSKEDMSAL